MSASGILTTREKLGSAVITVSDNRGVLNRVENTVHVVQPYSVNLVTTEVDKTASSYWEEFLPFMFRRSAEQLALDNNWNYLVNKRYLIRAEIVDKEGHKILPSPSLLFEVRLLLTLSGPTPRKWSPSRRTDTKSLSRETLSPKPAGSTSASKDTKSTRTTSKKCKDS